MKRIALIVFLTPFIFKAQIQTTLINFDTPENWIPGSAALSSYTNDHIYQEGLFTSTSIKGLRNGSTMQDGFPLSIGTYSWRLRDEAESQWYAQISSGGVSTFSVKIRRWDNSPSPDYTMFYSADLGENWIIVAEINNETLDNSSDFKTFHGSVMSSEDMILFRITRNSGERICIDDFEWTDNLPCPNLSVNAQNSYSICNGLSVLLEASGSQNEGIISWYSTADASEPIHVGNELQTASLTQTTSYWVEESYFQCPVSNRVEVVVNVTQDPPPTVFAGEDIEICEGEGVVLNASGALTYNWSDGITNGIEFFPSETGIYHVIGEDINGCTGEDNIEIIVHSLPIVNAGIDRSVCFGEPVTLSATGAVDYVWSDGIQNGTEFIPTTSGTYSVVGTDENSCLNEDEVTITVLPLPNNSTTTDGVSITAVATGMTYEWINCSTGQTITGQNGITFNPTSNGFYSVRVTNSENCSDTSECVEISILKTKEKTNDFNISLSPNPTRNKIKLDANFLENVSINVFNSLGKEVMHIENAVSGDYFDVSVLQNGVYMFKINHSKGASIIRMVKM
jgi:hypothetical protein